MTVIDDQVTIFLHAQEVAVSTLLVGIGSPSGLAVSVIEDEVTITLHSQDVGTLTLAVSLGGPDSVGGIVVRRAVDNQVTIVLELKIVRLAVSLQG